MASSVMRCAFAVSGLVGVAGMRQGVTPIEKVIELLGNLIEKVDADGKTEAVEFTRFKTFCTNQEATKTKHVAKSEGKIEELTATIEDLDGEINSLNDDIKVLGERITEIEEDTKTEIDTAKEAHEKYVVKEQDLSDGIDAIAGAIEALRNSKGAMTDAKLDLAQMHRVVEMAKKSKGLSALQVQMLGALAQDPAKSEYHSNEILDTLKSLLQDFKADHKELEETEFERKSISDKKLLGLSNELKFKTKGKAEKNALVGRKTGEKEDAETSKTDETTAKEADEAFKKELTKTCDDRASEFDQRKKARADELKAMKEATKELKSGAAKKYAANKKLVGLVGKSTAVSLLQVREQNGAAEIVKKAIARLDAAATELKSPLLAALATKVVLQADHFVKVRGLIRDLIQRLKDEAMDEADQKSFCDEEMNKALTGRDEQALEVEGQTTIIAEKTAKIAQLTEDIKTLGEEIAGLNKALNEATEIRKDEKAENEKTIKDSGEGKTSTDEAISILKTYYDNAFLLQKGAYTPPGGDRAGNTVGDLAPKMSYSGDYGGSQEASKGIIGILEVISTDFDRTVKTVTKEEADAQKEFDIYEKETNDSVDAKKKETADKEDETTAAKEAKANAKDALRDAKDLHKTALDELDKLKVMCVDGEETYAERVEKREKEIQALKDAMKLLDDWKN